LNSNPDMQQLYTDLPSANQQLKRWLIR
jgi:hypothetical protein